VTDAADPGLVWRVINGYAGYWAVVAAVRLGVFDALAEGPAPARELATACAADEARTAVLADALVAMGVLGAADDGYRLSATADELLVAGRPRSMRDLVLWSPGPQEDWTALERTVSGSRPPAPVDDDPESFYAHLVRATRPSQLVVARTALPTIGVPAGARVLELGAGAAPWTAAVLEADPGATAVVNDLAGVLDAAVEALGPLGARCTFAPGDYVAAPLPEGRYDLVVLGHVLRAEPDARAVALVARAAGSLTPTGRLVVTEYLGGRDPATHPQPALLAVTMLAATAEGRLCTAEAIEAWLARAGCRVVSRLEPIANTDVIVAAPAAGTQEEP